MQTHPSTLGGYLISMRLTTFIVYQFRHLDGVFPGVCCPAAPGAGCWPGVVCSYCLEGSPHNHPVLFPFTCLLDSTSSSFLHQSIVFLGHITHQLLEKGDKGYISFESLTCANIFDLPWHLVNNVSGKGILGWSHFSLYFGKHSPGVCQLRSWCQFWSLSLCKWCIFTPEPPLHGSSFCPWCPEICALL